MSNKINVLISSAGRRVSLLTNFLTETRKLNPNSKVFTTDLKPELSAACRLSHKSFKVPNFTDLSFIDNLVSICTENNIKVVIPTIDTELRLLAKNRELFSRHNIEIVISDKSLIETCRDKRKTHNFFNSIGVNVPRKINRVDPKFPLFIKPIDGSSSKDLYIIENASQLSEHLINNKNFMWMEYLSQNNYKEYTVDLYYSKNSKLICSVPRIRIAVRGGETNKGITDKNTILLQYIKKHLNSIPGARGCITLQLFQSIHEPNSIYGIEINPRFGGGYPLSYLAGANFPKWIIEEYILNQDIQEFDSWEDNLLLLRYDTEMTISDYKYPQ